MVGVTAGVGDEDRDQGRASKRKPFATLVATPRVVEREVEPLGEVGAWLWLEMAITRETHADSWRVVSRGVSEHGEASVRREARPDYKLDDREDRETGVSMRTKVRHAASLIALAVLVPAAGCASNKPAPEPKDERVVVEMPEEEVEEGSTTARTGDETDDGSPLGVPTCDRYLAKAIACGADLPVAAHEAYFGAIEQARATWRRLAKSNPEVLGEVCAEQLVRAREHMAGICPSVVWE